MTTSRTALVTGATSGLGFEAAAQLADKGWSSVTITGRSAERAERAREALVERTGKDVFSVLTLDLNSSESVSQAAADLARRGESVDFLLLNAGMVPGSTRIKTPEDVEVTFASTIVGHHQLTMQLLADDMVAENARIVIAGSEAARGDIPTFKPTDISVFAANTFDGDLAEAAEALIRGDDSVRYKSATTYADAKTLVAWWSAQLASRLPAGTTVNAVSPGSVPETNAARNAEGIMKYVMLPMFKYLPKRLGMRSSVATGAGRYLDAAGYPADVTGHFFASAPRKTTGPVEVVDLPHLRNTAAQEAGWSALVRVSGGVDYPAAA